MHTGDTCSTQVYTWGLHVYTFLHLSTGNMLWYLCCIKVYICCMEVTHVECNMRLVIWHWGSMHAYKCFLWGHYWSQNVYTCWMHVYQYFMQVDIWCICKSEWRIQRDTFTRCGYILNLMWRLLVYKGLKLVSLWDSSSY
jgi:hypothetical protein